MSSWLQGDDHQGLLTPHILWISNSSPKLCPQGLCTLCFLCQETHVHDSTPRFLQILHDPFSVVPSLTLTPHGKASFPHHPPHSFSALLSFYGYLWSPSSTLVSVDCAQYLDSVSPTSVILSLPLCTHRNYMLQPHVSLVTTAQGWESFFQWVQSWVQHWTTSWVFCAT